MATKWIGVLNCRWCDKEARVGIEKEGHGNTYRVICDSCGISEQAGFSIPAGEQIAESLTRK